MEEHSRYQITLTNLELEYLLHILKISNIAGYNSPQNINEQNLRDGRKRLIDRGYAAERDATLDIDASVASLIALAAIPYRVLNIEYTDQDSEGNYWFYLHQKFSIYHQVDYQSHLFQSIEQGTDWLAHLMVIFEDVPNDADQIRESYCVPVQEYQQITDGKV